MKKYVKKNIKLNELDALIKLAEEAVFKCKREYDDALSHLKNLLDKKIEIQNEELIKAVTKSNKSYDEIMNFLNSKDKTSED